MIFPIPDTCFFFNFILKTGMYHEEALEIERIISGNRYRYARCVVLDSVQVELAQTMLTFNTVLANLIDEMVASRESFKAMNLFYEAKREHLYRDHRDMLELLRAWITKERLVNPEFDLSNPLKLRNLYTKMRSAIWLHFSKYFSKRRATFYFPSWTSFDEAKTRIFGLEPHFANTRS